MNTGMPASELLGEVGVIQRVPEALNALAPRLTTAISAANRALPAKTTEVLIFRSRGPTPGALAAALAGEMCNAQLVKVTLASPDAAGLNVARKLLGPGYTATPSGTSACGEQFRT